MKSTSKTSSTSSENVCLVSGDYSINHIDHLAVIASIMEAPLVCDTENLYETIQKYYPDVKALYIHFHQQVLEYLAQNHDRVFFSVAPYRKDLSPMLEAFYGKQMEFWYCPHGNSDKTLEHYGMQHHALIYGDQMETRLKEEGYMEPLKTYARTGNVRFSFYEERKTFYDDLVEKEIFAKFAKKQTTYLYAPTWEDFEHSSSLFDVSMPLIDQLPQDINLIVKMHPWLEHHQAGHVNLIKARYGKLPNVVVLSQYPLVLPVLERTDLYIGDFSSIGYDFLKYNRPMFFFDPKKRIKKRPNDTCLHECGHVIPLFEYETIFSFIHDRLSEKNTFKEKRESLYHYAFGEALSPEVIRHAVQKGALASTSSHQK